MQETNNVVLPRKVKTIIKKYTNYHKTSTDLSLKINLINEIKKRNNETIKELYYEFENQYEILILGIKTNISINEYCSKLFKESHDSHSLIVLSSNITTQLLSVKTCLENGALISVKALFRVLIEAIDLFQACLTDEELNTSFSQMTMYDNNKYYFKNLSRGQLFKKCLITYKYLGLEEKKIKYLETRNRKLNVFLSGV